MLTSVDGKMQNQIAGFAHLAIEVPVEGASNEWLEAVSDEDYMKLG